MWRSRLRLQVGQPLYREGFRNRGLPCYSIFASVNRWLRQTGLFKVNKYGCGGARWMSARRRLKKRSWLRFLARLQPPDEELGRPCMYVKLPCCGARISSTCTHIIWGKFRQVVQLCTPRDRSFANSFCSAVFRSIGSLALFSAQMRWLLLENCQ
jgi:hypothetical protein